MDELCIVCQQSWEWHKAHKPKHKFQTENRVIELDEPPAPPQIARGGDPVLRLTLIKAGVITEEQLGETSRWVEAAREHGHAVVMLPDEQGEMQFHLMPLQEAMQAKASLG